jgi:type II secretory pathway component GspD/PulD (secretin)
MAVALASAAFAQTNERVFQLAHIKTPQARQEMVNVLRTVGDGSDVSQDSAAGTITVNGTASQIALAAWLVGALDQAPDGGMPRSYTYSDPRAPEVRIVYAPLAPNPQALQELVNAVRSVSEIQRIMILNSERALAMRGSTEQVALAEWLVANLDKAASQSAGKAFVDYGAPFGPSQETVRLFSFPETAAPEALIQLMTDIRSQTGMPRVVACVAVRAITVRGTADQIAEAERLVRASKM